MGHVISTYKDPSLMPDIYRPSIFDPNLGFPGGRVERRSHVTFEEMIAAGLKPKERDYCAHIKIAFNKCAKEHTLPFFYCSDLRHSFHECQKNDRLLRMKEYERERRLLNIRRQSSNLIDG